MKSKLKKIAWRFFRYLIDIAILFLIIKWFFVFPPRTVYLKVVFDGQYVKNQFNDINRDENSKEIEERLKKVIIGVSDIYEKEFDIKLEIRTIEFWSAKDTKTSIYELKNDFKIGEEDIVAGFTGRQIGKDNTTSGRACFNYILVNRQISLQGESLITAHEIGHLFGGMHFSAMFSKKSLMKKDVSGIEPFFDELNRVMIYFLKYHDFHFWLPDFLKSSRVCNWGSEF